VQGSSLQDTPSRAGRDSGRKPSLFETSFLVSPADTCQEPLKKDQSPQLACAYPYSQKHMREEFAKRLKGKHNVIRQSPVFLKRGLEMVGIG